MYAILVYFDERRQLEFTSVSALEMTADGYYLPALDYLFTRTGAHQLRGIPTPGLTYGFGDADAVVAWVADTEAECVSFAAGCILAFPGGFCRAMEFRKALLHLHLN